MICLPSYPYVTPLPPVQTPIRCDVEIGGNGRYPRKKRSSILTICVGVAATSQTGAKGR